MRKQYQCDFCSELFDSEKECKEHENNDCDENRKIKSCKTCKFETSDVGGTNKVYYSCKIKFKDCSPVSWKKNCEGWESDEGYAH